MSYYAFVKEWLLPGLPFGYNCNSISLFDKKKLQDLSIQSGLFPSRPWTLAPTVCLLNFKICIFEVFLNSVKQNVPLI